MRSRALALVLLLSAASAGAQGYREYSSPDAPPSEAGRKPGPEPKKGPGPASVDPCRVESSNAILAMVLPLAERALSEPRLLGFEMRGRAKAGPDLPSITSWVFRFVDPGTGDLFEYTYTSDMDHSYMVERFQPDGKAKTRRYWVRKAGSKEWRQTSPAGETIVDRPFFNSCRLITRRVTDSTDVQAALRRIGADFCSAGPKGVTTPGGVFLALMSANPEGGCRPSSESRNRPLPKAVAERENFWLFEADGRAPLYLDGPTAKLLRAGR